MTKYIKLLNLFCIILVVVLIIYMLLDLIPMYLYNSTTTGKEINDIEEIEICNRIINKKYEIVLYGRTEDLKTLYAKKYYKEIDNFNITDNHENILNDFYTVNIEKVYKKAGNVYIVKCLVTYLDNSDREFTTIIRMNYDKSKAIILYDDMFN